MSRVRRPRNKAMEKALKAAGVSKSKARPEPEKRVEKGAVQSKVNARPKIVRNKLKKAVSESNRTGPKAASVKSKRAVARPDVNQRKGSALPDQIGVLPIAISGKTHVRKKFLRPIAPAIIPDLYTGSFYTQQPNALDGPIELVVGLDFGTATTKVVIMEPGSQRAWAIPFIPDLSNPYLLPSRVYAHDNSYDLDGQGELIANLKLPLLLGSAPKGHIDHVVAFLSLVLRQAREWFLDNTAKVYPGYEFEWHYHLGLPASNYKNKALVRKFRTLLLAAVETSLVKRPVVTASAVKQSVVAAHACLDGRREPDQLRSHPDLCAVFPEIAAQIHGYVKSDRWDKSRPKFMLVDIGGGTVDACILTVTEPSLGQLRYRFLRSSVQNRGVVMLHQDRLKWIKDSASSSELPPKSLVAELDNMNITLDETLPVPEKANEYLVDATFPEAKHCSDNRFYNDYGQELFRDVILPVKQNIAPDLEEWKALPLLLCGGGSQHALYRRFISACNNHGRSGSAIRVDPIALERPEELEAPDCRDHDYHRLSVAYGLSHGELGEIIPEIPLDGVEVRAKESERYRRHYIDKDQV